MSAKRPFNDQGRGGQNKRRREIEYDLDGDVLESKLARVGESGEPIERQLDNACKLILREADKDKVVRLVCECAAELPEKTAIYSACVGLVNCVNYELAGDIVEATIQYLKDCLRKCKWDDARSLIRFCADLANSRVITNGSLVSLFENLVDVTAEENIPQVRSDFYVFAVLSSIPWVGKELAEKDDLDQLLSTIEEYIQKRSKAHVAGLKVWSSDTPHPQEEYLDCLWAQVNKLRADKWNEYQIIRLQHLFPELSSATQHILPDFSPPAHEPSFTYPFPRIVFRLFDYTDCPEGSAVLPGAHSIERFLAEESIRNILNLFYFNRKDCAKALLSCPSIQRLPFDYMIVELIFAEMLALPKSTHIEIFYGSLLIELCKMQAQTLPLVLAQAVQLMFERMDSMNGICIDRLSSWFAYLLSNFQFKWNWEDWSMCVSQDPLNPKPTFIRETFIRCMRLSYQERVSEFAPDDLKSFVPKPTQPIEKFGADYPDSNIREIAEQLRNAFKEKNTELIPSLESVTQVGNFSGDSAKVNLFVNVLLNTASQSYTHMFTALSHWLVQLNDMIISEEAQVVVLHSLFEVWQNHQQLMVVATEKLMKYGIIDASAVVNWIFSDEMAPELTRFYVWEILHKTMLRKLAAVKQHRTRLEEERESLRKFSYDAGEVAADNADDIPTEENIERLEEQLDSILNEAKCHLQLIISKVVSTIMSHVRLSDTKHRSHWMRWMLHRLQQMLFEYHDLVFQHLQSFESLIFTQDLEPEILQTFKELTTLRA